jgi:hypothetical protein
MGHRPCKIHFKRRGTNKKLKKVVHYRYVDLYDGLHPHMSLSELWLNVMCDSINRDLSCAVSNENGVVENEAFGVVEDEDLGVVEEELDEMEENDSWDFKRIV